MSQDIQKDADTTSNGLSIHLEPVSDIGEKILATKPKRTGFWWFILPHLAIISVEVMYLGENAIVLNSTIDEFQLAFLSALLAIPLLYMFAKLTKAPKKVLKRKETYWLVFAGILNVSVIQVCLFMAVRYAKSLTLVGVLLPATTPFTCFISWIVGPQKPSDNPVKATGLAIAIVGVAISIFYKPLVSDSILAILCMIGVTLGFAIYILIQSYLVKTCGMNSNWMCFYIYLYGVPPLFIFMLFRTHLWNFRISYMGPILYNSVVIAFLSTLVYAWGNVNVQGGTEITALYVMVAPIIHALYDFLFIDAQLELLFALGVIFMFTGFVVSIIGSNKDKLKHNVCQ
ncbi:hypothetical protein PCE1_003819 [Barthelona sp. PCE]